MINHKLISFSAVQIYDVTFLYSIAKIVVVVVSFSYKEAQFKKFWSLVKNSCPHDKNINETPVSRSASSRFDLPHGICIYFYMGMGDTPPRH